MAKRMVIMLVLLGLLFGAIYGYITFRQKMMQKYMALHANPNVSVSALKATYQAWEKTLKASGTLKALQGVDVTTEIPGMIRTIYFKSGMQVKTGMILVQLNNNTEKAQLKALEATRELAKKTYERDKAQFAIKAISKQTLDADQANLDSLDAQIEEQKSTLAKKSIKAPFSGHLGISAVDVGQYLNTGDKVVTLQTLHPIFVDFNLPQQNLIELKVGQEVVLTTDSFPNKTFSGKITTINPKVDPSTRNVQIRATVSNPEYLLLPGMFVTVEVDVDKAREYLTLPQAAISFNPYGEIAYIVNETGKDKEGKPLLAAKQVFVKVGETRGDQIAILEGIKEGDLVVTGGQLKLKNGSPVQVNNKIVPENDPAPTVSNES